MYDFCGEYAFTVGLPAKSGLSGSLFIVIPGVCGISIYSPRLDKLGNTVRGVEFSKRLVETFPFHTYAGLVTDQQMTDPRRSETTSRVEPALLMCAAASRDDIAEVRRLIARGIDIDSKDYDLRTALHLAASEGHEEMARFLLDRGANREALDRWGNTPLDGAKRAGHDAVAEMLKTYEDAPGSLLIDAEE